MPIKRVRRREIHVIHAVGRYCSSCCPESRRRDKRLAGANSLISGSNVGIARVGAEGVDYKERDRESAE